MKNCLRLASLRSVGVVLALVGLMTVGFWVLVQPASHVAKAGTDATTALGDPLPNLTALETQMFGQGALTFGKDWDALGGLGPVFTQLGCQMCHATPVNGGAGTAATISTLFGKINTDGSFNPLTNEGGIVLQPGTNQHFIANCKLKGEVVPPDATIVAKHQAPPLFGAGLIDNIPDSQILANAVDKGLGIRGVANQVTDENGNPRVGHFGLKAQAADLLQFSALAMQHEMGITNPISPNEDLPQGKPFPPACSKDTEPNDNGTQMVAIYHFVVYLAPNPPGLPNANGQAKFISVGCDHCHIPPGTPSSYTTSPSAIVPVVYNGRTIVSRALSSQPVNLYSDLLLHDMGGADGDGIVMSLATGTQWRTAPLWGLSIKLSHGIGLLHDGSAPDVPSALVRHGGEASTVISNFNALSPQDQTDLIAFISSL
ncbi:MAG: hypothetical protein LAN83_02800 [Acidobacteriia bacterium]|nr:hypothetical protein [Terriglobia bacterium]